MQSVEQIPQVPLDRIRSWQTYLLDTVAGTVGSLLITSIIDGLSLYPRIPDIAVVYLLLVIPLAITRGRYSAIVASVAAFLSFDFFLVPPFYSFSIASGAELISLLVFLATAMIISQLAGMVRRRAEVIRLQERRLRILYELLRVYNSTDKLEDQLDVVALSTARVFSSWGLRECVLLLPDENGQLRAKADAPINVEPFELLPAEWEAAMQVGRTGHMTAYKSEVMDGSICYLFPLRSGARVVGVLYLRIRSGAPWLDSEQALRAELERNNPQVEFARSYLDQISSLVDRALLQHTQAFPIS